MRLVAHFLAHPFAFDPFGDFARLAHVAIKVALGAGGGGSEEIPLAHAALERALNGVERPVFYKGEQVGSYRRYDESLTRALLRSQTMGGNPMFGRLAGMAERHARDFESLLARLAEGKAVETGALTPEDPAEFDRFKRDSARENFCPSALSDDELMEQLQEIGWE
jgi:hypothetical protein